MLRDDDTAKVLMRFVWNVPLKLKRKFVRAIDTHLSERYPIMRARLRLGNHVTLIAGFRNADLLFWVKAGERVSQLQAEFPDLLDVIYTSNDGSFCHKGFVTTPLEAMLKDGKSSQGRKSPKWSPSAHR